MTILLAILAWYAVGLLGSFLVLYFAFYRDGLDIDVSDIALGAALALLGLGNLILGLGYMIGHVANGARWGSKTLFRSPYRRW